MVKAFMQIFEGDWLTLTRLLLSPQTFLPPLTDLTSSWFLTEISLLELRFCRNSPSGFSEAHGRKEEKYAPLILDLEERGKVVSFITLKIGTLGHFIVFEVHCIALRYIFSLM